MRRILSAALGFWFSLACAAQAQESTSPVLVELYTSQGCSSCPPADVFFAQLAPRDDVIALALHVDYWDYIGWTDSFADSAYSDRQKNYARAVGANTIYTPQMIIAGVDRTEGFRAMQVSDLIQRHRQAARRVDLSLSRAGGMVEIHATAETPLGYDVAVQLVRYIPSRTVVIESGENAGRTMTYHNIVTVWDLIDTWNGQGALRLSARAAGDEPVVVILQRAGHGPVLAASRLR